jgi:two-component system sensor histidine kinase KdpD
MEYLLSSGFICAVSAVCFLFTRYIGPEAVAFILLVALSIIAMFFDILPVLLAATLSALIWDYFFLIPRFNLRVGNTEAKIMLFMYFVPFPSIRAIKKFAKRKTGQEKKELRKNPVQYPDQFLISLHHSQFSSRATDNLMASPNLFLKLIRSCPRSLRYPLLFR